MNYSLNMHVKGHPFDFFGAGVGGRRIEETSSDILVKKHFVKNIYKMVHDMVAFEKKSLLLQNAQKVCFFYDLLGPLPPLLIIKWPLS